MYRPAPRRGKCMILRPEASHVHAHSIVQISFYELDSVFSLEMRPWPLFSGWSLPIPDSDSYPLAAGMSLKTTELGSNWPTLISFSPGLKAIRTPMQCPVSEPGFNWLKRPADRPTRPIYSRRSTLKRKYPEYQQLCDDQGKPLFVSPLDFLNFPLQGIIRTNFASVRRSVLLHPTPLTGLLPPYP
jgi:hypothetical protein